MVVILVGDNPFHGVSHLSQAKSRLRDKNITDAKCAARLVSLARINGADGFMFSANDVALNVLREMTHSWIDNAGFKLYGVIPYAYDYVRRIVLRGAGGLVTEFLASVMRSVNPQAMLHASKTVVYGDIVDAIKALVDIELCKIEAASKNRFPLQSLMFHEIVVDTLVAYGLGDVIAEAVHYVGKRVTPGLATRNMPALIRILQAYPDALEDSIIAAPFNKIGYQMSPRREGYEKLVTEYSNKVVAMSVLAGGYLKPSQAFDYISEFKDHLLGLALGVSKEDHARETFQLARKMLS